jgi:CubicO group peptidase (beta-lactamase class C family)
MIAERRENAMTIQGDCDARFREVRAEFERNFARRGEVGASVCVLVDGRPVVDLWGGLADRRAGTPWQRDTLVVVWSCTKGAVALCVHLLVARGLLDLDAPVSLYWPEFAQAGKGDVTLRLVLSHQAGLPAIRQPLPPGALYDWETMTAVIAAEAPFWEPGTRQGYHAVTIGHILGEVVRCVTGKDIGAFFRDEVAGPLGLDFHIGLPAEAEPRVALTLRPDPIPPGEVHWRFLARVNEAPESIQALIVRNTGRRAGDTDSREAHAALLPSQGGISNARGLAGLYAPLALGGAGLVDADTLAALSSVHSATACDEVLLVGMRFGLGFLKSADNRAGPPDARDSVILAESAFGHAGLGGSLGFADPGHRLAFGYAMNKQGGGVLLNERGQALVDAVYRALGCSSDRSGRWV